MTQPLPFPFLAFQQLKEQMHSTARRRQPLHRIRSQPNRRKRRFNRICRPHVSLVFFRELIKRQHPFQIS
jgi:hypothetical protein